MSNFFQTFGLGQQGGVDIPFVRVQHLHKQPSPDHLRQNTDGSDVNSKSKIVR